MIIIYQYDIILGHLKLSKLIEQEKNPDDVIEVPSPYSILLIHTDKLIDLKTK